MSDLRNAVLNAVDIQTETVDVPEWEVKLELRGMTGVERSAFTERTRSGDLSNEGVMAELLISSAYDPESGERVFEPADRDILVTKNARVLDRLFRIAAMLSGIGGGLEGKSETPPNSGGS